MSSARATEDARIASERTPTRHTDRAARVLYGEMTIRWSAAIARIVSIKHPFEDVAVHMMEAKRIGREIRIVHSDCSSSMNAFFSATVNELTIIVCLRGRDSCSSPEWSCRPAPRPVTPTPPLLVGGRIRPFPGRATSRKPARLPSSHIPQGAYSSDRILDSANPGRVPIPVGPKVAGLTT
jgi:hypothetical protein